jgi:hypothetical protein
MILSQKFTQFFINLQPDPYSPEQSLGTMLLFNTLKTKEACMFFIKTVGYGLRALIEAQISRIKRCIGSSLKTQRLESQEREGKIIANILNQWNAFGK